MIFKLFWERVNTTWLNSKILAVIPMFLTVNIIAIVVWYFEISSISMPLILGAIAGGLVDLDNRLSGRVKNLFYTLIAFSISSLVVQITFVDHYLFILVMAILTFFFTMLGAIGQRYSTIAFGSLVVALYTILAYNPEQVWFLNPILILMGTSLYSLLTMLVYLLFPLKPAQENLANAYLALADYLQTKAEFFNPDNREADLDQQQTALVIANSRVVQAFNLCRSALFYRSTGNSVSNTTLKMINSYFIAQDIHERINSNYFNYAELLSDLKYSDLIFRIRYLLELQAKTCRAFAKTLQRNQAFLYYGKVKHATMELEQSFSHFKMTTPDSEHISNLTVLLESLQKIELQLAHLDANVKETEHSVMNWRIHQDRITGLANIFRVIKNQCTFESQLFRHAVRLTIVVTVCCLIANNIPLERGYWILLTAVFVCQPNYTTTQTRLKQRIIGTILGVLVGSLMPYFTTSLESKLGIVVIASTLFLFFRTNNYSFSTFFITIQVLISFNIIGVDIASATLPRAVDTIIGCVIAGLAVAYLWPDWKYLRLKYTLINALKSNARYLLTIMVQLQFGNHHDLKYRIIRRQAHDNATALNTAVSNLNYQGYKDKTRLNNAFELLKLNYSLLSYIAALATFRSQMNTAKLSTQMLIHLYPISRRIIAILDNFDQLTGDEFEQSMQEVTELLQQLQHSTLLPTTATFLPLIKQLEAIAKTLPTLFIDYQKEIEFKVR
ncbi:YccS family putative transporter [Gallibacterium trehalosifermentans]|uniref:YccS family putative transporter n=1 Tax=Gallibacterium trehalosifermentans TaxID=516935 RepID=A0ABV6H2U1_9PAST